MAHKYNLAGINETIDTVIASEKVTKEGLKALSRDLLFMLHDTVDNPQMGDQSLINRLIAGLTPVNKKVAMEYFKAFMGYREELTPNGETCYAFLGKDKTKVYDAARSAAMEFLNEGGNIWTWSEKNVEVKAKPFDLSKFAQVVGAAMKKGEKAQLSKADMLSAIISQGIEAQDLLDALSALTECEVLIQGKHVPNQEEPAPVEGDLGFNAA